jgi:hypothetical protein
MANELAPFKVSLPTVSAAEMQTLDEVAKGSEFLPRIQLVTKGKYVDQGKIKPGHWGVPLPGGEEIEDLGEKIDVVPFCYRPKALDMSDKEAIVAVYDVADPEFQRIKNAPKNTGCMWGPSFLVLLRQTGKLYELFFGNKSGRNEAGKLKPFLPTEENGGQPSPATLAIRYKKTPEYGWHVPVISKCSEPIDPKSVKFTAEQLQEEVEKFRNPEKGAEKVVDDEGNVKTNKRAR